MLVTWRAGENVALEVVPRFHLTCSLLTPCLSKEDGQEEQTARPALELRTPSSTSECA